MKCHMCDDEATEVVTGVTERFFCKEHYDEFNKNNRDRNEGSSDVFTDLKKMIERALENAAYRLLKERAG
jgi:hypothetical protein